MKVATPKKTQHLDYNPKLTPFKSPALVVQKGKQPSTKKRKAPVSKKLPPRKKAKPNPKKRVLEKSPSKQSVKRKAKKEAGKKAKEDKKKAQEEAKKLQKAADENQKIELDKKIEELMKQKKEIGAPKKVSLPNCQYCNCRVTVCNARKTKVFGEAGNAMMTVEEYVESLADGPEKEAMKLASMCKRQNGGRKRKSSEDSPQASPQISEAPGPEPAPKATEIDMKAAEQLEASAHPTTGGKNLGDLASIAGEAAAEDSSEDDSDSSESEESDSDDE